MVAVPVEAEKRLAEICSRYGSGNPVSRSIIKATSYITATLYAAQDALKART